MKKFVILLATLVFILTASSSAFAQPQEEKEIIEVIEKYYLAFAQEDMTQYINILSLSVTEKENKQKYMQTIWDSIDTIEYHITQFKIEQMESFAAVTYTAEFTLYFPKEKRSVTNTREYTALLVKEDSWKIRVVGNAKEMNQALAEIILTNTNINLNDSNKQEPSLCGDGICELGETCVQDCTILNYNCTTCSESPESTILSENKTTSLRCVFDNSFLNEEISLEELGSQMPKFIADSITKDSIIKMVIDDTTTYMHIESKILKPALPTQKVDYTITTDSCTISYIEKGSLSFEDALNNNLITIKGSNIGTGFKTWIASVFVTITSWFKEKPGIIIVEAESGTLVNPGRYTFIGPTGRGPGELYLGDKDASAVYTIEAPKTGTYTLYLVVSDDGVHLNGARSVVFTFDSKEIQYNHVSKNYVANGNFWGTERLGTIDLKKGKHTLTITKPTQTSAAFTLDRLELKIE